MPPAERIESVIALPMAVSTGAPPIEIVGSASVTGTPTELLLGEKPEARHLSGAFLDFNLDVASHHAYVVPSEIFVGWRTEGFSSAHVEPCAVPWTGHFEPFDFPLGQRPFLMAAGVVDGKERAPNIEERDVLAVDVHE